MITKERRSEICRKSYLKNRDKILEKQKQYRINNPEAVRIVKKKWNDKNKKKKKQLSEDYKERRNYREKKRRKNDVNFKLSTGLRSRLNLAIKTDQKVGSAVSDLGCTIPELKQHLENQFKEGMNWDNWTTDGWHIDHILPLISFDLTDRKQFLIASNFKNLQPLWAVENLMKGSSL